MGIFDVRVFNPSTPVNQSHQLIASYRRASAGEVRGGTFGKLLEMLVGSVLLYGVEVWGCGRQLRPI